MLPLSPGRPSPLTAQRETIHESFAWLRPANIAAASSAELRALIVWLAIAVSLGVMIAFGHVWLRLQVIDFGYHLSATRQVIQRLQQEAHELAVNAATLEAPGRLEDAARKRLGMTRCDEAAETVLP